MLSGIFSKLFDHYVMWFCLMYSWPHFWYQALETRLTCSHERVKLVFKLVLKTTKWREQIIPIISWKKKTLWRVFWRTLNSSFLLQNLLLKKTEPENVAELSDEVLSRLGLTTIGDHRVPCANTEKQHQSAPAAAFSEGMALFIRQTGSSRTGGPWWDKKTFFVKDLESKFQLFSQQPSI